MLGSVNIHIITNESNRGDQSQALGVRDALAQSYSEDSVVPHLYRWDAGNIEAFKKYLGDKSSELQNSEHHVVIGVGEHGLKALSDIHKLKLPQNISLHWQGHQVMKGLEKAAASFETVALPEHVLDEETKKKLSQKTRLIPTIGVAHNITREKIADLDQVIKSDLVPENLYHAVFLGGDAPTGKGKIKYFTPLEAVSFASRVAEVAKQDGASVIVTNGPRTGKFDSRSSEVIGKHDGTEVDRVSEAFIDNLKAAGVKTVFYDFVYKGESKFKPIVSLISKNPASKAFVTGESTSMLSEIGDNILYKNMYVLPISSMNDAHEKHVDTLYRNGKANILAAEKDQDKTFIGDVRSNVIASRASEVIAQAVKEVVSNKNKLNDLAQEQHDNQEKPSSLGGDQEDLSTGQKFKNAYSSLQGKVANILATGSANSKPQTADQQLGQELSQVANALNNGYGKRTFASRVVEERNQKQRTPSLV